MSRGGLKAAFELAVSILSQNWPQASYSFSHETSLWAASDKVVPHVLRISDIYSKNPDWDIPINVLRDFAELLQKGSW